MDTVIINFTSGSVKTYTNVSQTILSGNHLIIITKETIESDGEHFIITTNEVHDLIQILNYTTKIKTKKYGNE
jgi:hypothetical protein